MQLAPTNNPHVHVLLSVLDSSRAYARAYNLVHARHTRSLCSTARAHCHTHANKPSSHEVYTRVVACIMLYNRITDTHTDSSLLEYRAFKRTPGISDTTRVTSLVHQRVTCMRVNNLLKFLERRTLHASIMQNKLLELQYRYSCTSLVRQVVKFFHLLHSGLCNYETCDWMIARITTLHEHLHVQHVQRVRAHHTLAHHTLAHRTLAHTLAPSL